MDQEVVIIAECDQLLLSACKKEVSDIYLAPKSGEYVVSFRRHGHITRVNSIPENVALRIVTYLKYLAALDISERRKPQSGAFHKEIDKQTYAFRISTLPSVLAKESIVVRVLKQNDTQSLQDLCYHPQAAQQLSQLVERGQGLILMTGATGTGKTTTMYSLVQYCQRILARHVISLEDPVEISQEEILQIQVNERAGVTYAAGLKAILRHSPDVIMIGEIRDRETAQIAIEASLTGHLVLSTIHAKSTVDCLYRLSDLGISLEVIRQSLIGIVSQKLVKVEQDQQKAMHEILTGDYLQQAIEAKRSGEFFTFPKTSYDAVRPGVQV